MRGVRTCDPNSFQSSKVPDLIIRVRLWDTSHCHDHSAVTLHLYSLSSLQHEKIQRAFLKVLMNEVVLISVCIAVYGLHSGANAENSTIRAIHLIELCV